MNLLNTLYVMTPGAYVYKERENVLVTQDRKELLRVPIHRLSGIVCFGHVSVSPFILEWCAERSLHIAMLTENGRFLGRFEGLRSGGAILRRQQMRAADNESITRTIAAFIVRGKIKNSLALLRRATRERNGPAVESLSKAVDAVSRLEASLPGAETIDQIRGYEGEAAAQYFSVMDAMIVVEDASLRFEKRSRRPPKNPVNAMLSFGYALLLNDCIAALQAASLDPWVGFLHVERPGRPSLALDLMEEFRAYFVDRMVLALINRQQVQSNDFETSATGGVTLKDQARRIFLTEYQTRKSRQISHPLLEQAIPAGLLPFVQARLLSRVARGELDEYPPFAFR
ncbi:MAG TPA: type I-C CRISPR-associated endonuclease Cas1c [bacterium]|nr:type I-C CRISPR-associated endonuclease Cas1c [bacterium]